MQVLKGIDQSFSLGHKFHHQSCKGKRDSNSAIVISSVQRLNNGHCDIMVVSKNGVDNSK